ncbi:nucleoside 2-deoxyribosyltransferase [Aquabacter sp. CN5-332]|uniref:nucleoside 2-deoxyribosyltransferase n=1 Tax=Aquabacter sp. CN5-332 TaxID=3156608 RepID=UPI0032B61260
MDGSRPSDGPLTIRDRCVAGIETADAVIANISPLRGPHMDPGTAWELGYAEARGKPVFLWTVDRSELIDRIPGAPSDNGWRDGDGHAIEDFGAIENLMITMPDTFVYDDPEKAIRAATEALSYIKVRRGMQVGIARAFVMAGAAALVAGLLANFFIWK